VTPRGRPRDPSADDRILAIAGRILLQKGIAELHIDEVAAEAGVARTTVYRRWPTKDHLAVAVIADMQNEVPIEPSDDDPATAITEWLNTIAAGLNAIRHAGTTTTIDPRSAASVAELAAAAARHPDIGSQVREQFERRHQRAVRAIEHAVSIGRFPTTVDAEVLVDQLVGPLYYRVLITGKPVDPGYVDRLVRQGLPDAPTGKAP